MNKEDTSFTFFCVLEWINRFSLYCTTPVSAFVTRYLLAQRSRSASPYALKCVNPFPRNVRLVTCDQITKQSFIILRNPLTIFFSQNKVGGDRARLLAYNIHWRRVGKVVWIFKMTLQTKTGPKFVLRQTLMGPYGQRSVLFLYVIPISWGGGVLPYISYMGMCRPKGYDFWAVFGLKTGTGFDRTTRAYKRNCLFNSKWIIDLNFTNSWLLHWCEA